MWNVFILVENQFDDMLKNRELVFPHEIRSFVHDPNETRRHVFRDNNNKNFEIQIHTLTSFRFESVKALLAVYSPLSITGIYIFMSWLGRALCQIKILWATF